MKATDPLSSGPSASLVEDEDTLEEIESDHDAPEPATEADIQTEYFCD